MKPSSPKDESALKTKLSELVNWEQFYPKEHDKKEGPPLGSQTEEVDEEVIPK